MLTSIRLSLLVIVGLLAMTACDIIEAPYLENANQIPANEQCVADAAAVDPFPENGIFERKVLLEEITGHQCGNCPEQSDKAYDLYLNQKPGKVVLIYLHSGFYAQTKTADKYTTDYTCADAVDLDAEFNGIGYPYGIVDRTLGTPGNANKWINDVEQRLQLPAEAGIRIFNCYDADSMRLTTVVDVKYIADATDQEYLGIYLIEDKIEDWQKDYRFNPSDLPDYTHHNILRGSINGVWGQPLTSELVKNGDTFTVSASYDIPADYAIENCKVVAFVHNFATKEVRQVEEATIIQ